MPMKCVPNAIGTLMLIAPLCACNNQPAGGGEASDGATHRQTAPVTPLQQPAKFKADARALVAEMSDSAITTNGKLVIINRLDRLLQDSRGEMPPATTTLLHEDLESARDAIDANDPSAFEAAMRAFAQRMETVAADGVRQ